MAEHLTIPGALEWDAVERHSIASLRYAGGKEHDVKYVSEVAYDALKAELKAIKESVEGYESPEHAAQVADELGYQCGIFQKRLTVAVNLLRESLEEFKEGDDYIDRVIAVLKDSEAHEQP